MKKIATPILLAATAIAGVFLGRFSMPQAHNQAMSVMQMPPNSKLQNIIDIIEMYYVDSVSTDSIVEKVIPKMLEQLDPHTVYIPAKDLDDVTQELKSDFGGVGIQFTIRDDTVGVVQVISGGPSSHLGVLPGDKIIKVNGHNFTGKNVTNKMVMDSLRGTIGTRVGITVLRGNDTHIDFDITRGLIPMHSVNASYMIDKTTGYLVIDRFAEKTYDEMIQAIAKLRSKGCKNLIVDLRSNQGGLLEVVIRMCNEFLSKGDLIVYTEGAHQARRDIHADGRGVCQDMGVYVLIDEYSASASEIFAGAVQDNDRGVVLGRRSFGKGLVQTQIELPDRSGLRITVARYYTPAGRCIQRPYNDGKEEYYQEMSRRYTKGELFSADSVKFNTDLQFKTKKGRTVYGGGGIMPDVFVPRDTASASKALYNLRAKSVLYSFSLDYVEKHRKELKEASDLYSTLKSTAFLPQLTTYAKNKKINMSGMPKEEQRIAEREVRAYIGRSMGEEDVFYRLLNDDDDVLKAAMSEVSGRQ